VHRFDIEADGTTRKGMEDLCSLLLLRPEQKYESTWERVVGRIKNVVPQAARQNEALSRLADMLLLTYALRNADCHTKNIALLYGDRDDISLAPVYDMLTTTVYDDYRNNPPGMPVDGRSTWTPGKVLERFLQTRCNVMPAQTLQRVERICESIVQVTPQVIGAARRHAHFQETGKRMLHAWNDGMNSLRLQKSWSLPSLGPAIAAARFSAVRPAAPAKPEKIGRSALLGKR
jgi:serine/threonine-protein kinase HipA